MTRARTAVGAAAVVLAVAAGYLTADVLDLAPGVLTRATAAAVPTPTVSGTPVPVTLPSPSPAPSSDPLGGADDAPLPTPAGLAAAVAAAAEGPELRGGLGVSVRDGVTGEVLWGLDADRPRVPSSSAKVLAALAVADGLDLDARMPTTVLAGAGTGDLVLVARGDVLLSPTVGDPAEVAGRAGLADLADQVAAALRAEGRRSVTLRLDLSYAPGPRLPATWKAVDVRDGFGGPVVMTGLATTRAVAGRAAPADPEAEVAATFVTRLRERGVTAALTPAATWTAPAPAGARELGRVESATYREVLDLALDVSNNTVTENLVRQAAAAMGRPTTSAGANVDFVVERLRANGVPTDGLRLTDVSGLSPGQAASATTLSAALAVAATGEVDGWRDVVAGLPVAGLTGTLAGRFDDRATGDVAGVPRAKTGTLRAGSSLAGTTVDADGRLLLFAVQVDGYPETYAGTQRARAALDRITAAITRCGCR